MVVFICILINCIFLLPIVILFSSISINVKRFELKEDDCIKKILEEVKNRQYSNVLDFVKIRLFIKFNILGLFPIPIIILNGSKINKIITKAKIKKIKRQQKEQQNKSKLRIKKYKDIILKSYIIDKYNLFMQLEIFDAETTAIVVSFTNVLLAILTIYINENNSKSDKLSKCKYKFKVEPIYNNSNNISCKVKFNTKISIYLFKIVKGLLMYKYNLFVNNTNKYKVKES